MTNWWRNLSVVKKLYAVVGLMAFLIAIELFTLVFAMNTLSAVRALVEGEARWSKAQKDAIHDLYQYALTGDARHYEAFQKDLDIPMGDRQARLELLKPDYNYEIVREGLARGGSHPNDTRGVIKLLARFSSISFVKDATKAWAEADMILDQLLIISKELHETLQQEGPTSPKIGTFFDRISTINRELTRLEITFSSSLGEGSRWLETVLMTLLTLTVLAIESTGLMLTVRFSQNLHRSLKELTETAKEVGQKNFNRRAPVHSKDELGQLAESLNEMAESLKINIGEKKQAENANQVKSIFLANMSHEIRTPLGVILGFVGVLKNSHLSRQEELQYLEIIEKTGKNLGKIINDILDLSKIESGHLEIEMDVFSIEDFFSELRILFQFKAQQNNNKITFEIDEQSPKEIATDRLRLQQILMNLLSNALRFTENGNITLKYSGDSAKAQFSVTDTGIGLTPEQVKKLFALFSQADQSTTRKYGGTGLGLILSQKLAQALGGDVILAQTKPGEGATFLATVNSNIHNIARIKMEKKSEICEVYSREVLVGKKILVVDDSMENQLLLNILLKKVGLIVDTADNGDQGAHKALQGEYDVILMDLQMPVLDGYAATLKLREEGYLKPIIALTANAMKEDWERCMTVGCNDYLTKPIEAEKLLNAIAKNI